MLQHNSPQVTGNVSDNCGGTTQQCVPGSRVLDDSYQTNLAGVAVAKDMAERLSYVSEFLEELKRSGSLKKMVDGNGLRGVEVAR